MLKILNLTFMLILLFTSTLLSKDLEKISIQNSNKTIIFSKSDLSYLKNKKHINMCVDPNWMPFEKIENKKHIGITADYMALVEKKISIPIRLIETKTWTQTLEFAKNRKCDIISLAVTTASRKKYLNFTKQYLSFPLVIATKRGIPFIDNLDNLANKKIGIVDGYAYAEILQNKYPKLNFISVENIHEGLQKVDTKKLFGYIGGSLPISYELQRYYNNDMTISGKFDYKMSLGIAVRNDDLVLLSILEKAIDSIDYRQKQKIINTWTSVKIENIQNYTLVWQLSILFVLILLIIFYFLFKQKKLKNELLQINKTLEFKVAEQVDNITKTQKRFEAIFETVMDGVAIVDLNSNFLLVNNAYAKILEKTKEELYKTSCIALTISSMREQSEQIFRTVLLKGNYKGYKKQCVANNGTIIDINMDLVLMSNKKAILMVARDITQYNIDKREKELQNQQLLHQSRLAQMGEMISMIAHQWRQPLNSISLTTGNLQLKLMMDDVNHDFFKHELCLIEEYSQHLSETIDDFRGFFKEQKEQKNTTLEKIVNNTLNIVRVSIENKNIQIITTLECKKQFKTYENEVIQVVLNIIKNAEDALLEKNSPNPTIWIESLCSISTTNPILTIRDNAGGIPKDIIDKIFNPYFSTKLEKDGTGLGLHMSKVIIEEHCGGKLSVRNDKDGAVFELMFNNILK